MKPLFKSWANLKQRIQKARAVGLFFDYDGTLTPIVSRPDLALCPPEVKQKLAALRDSAGIFPAIISGRSLEDLYSRIGVPGITYVGNHGLEIRNPAGIHRKNLSSAHQKEMAAIAAFLKKALGEMPGILFEDKGVTLAVHYRQVARDDRERLFREMEEGERRWGGGWRTMRGKMVFEIQPRMDFHKGKAVQSLLKTLPDPELLSFYFGDDRTDEDAFRFLKSKGITVFVGPAEGPSGAEFFLENPAGVAEFMERFLAARRKAASF